MNLEKLKEILSRNSFRRLYFVSLISSDTIQNKESAEMSLKHLEFIDENLDNLDLSDEIKKETREFLDKGFEIVKRDLKEFEDE